MGGAATGETVGRRMPQCKSLQILASQQRLSGLQPEAVLPADPRLITTSKSGRRVDSNTCYQATSIAISVQEEDLVVALRKCLASPEAAAWLASQGMRSDEVEVIKRLCPGGTFDLYLRVKDGYSGFHWLASPRYERLLFKTQQAGLEDGSAGHILQTGRRTFFLLPEHICAAGGAPAPDATAEGAEIGLCDFDDLVNAGMLEPDAAGVASDNAVPEAAASDMLSEPRADVGSGRQPSAAAPGSSSMGLRGWFSINTVEQQNPGQQVDSALELVQRMVDAITPLDSRLWEDNDLPAPQVVAGTRAKGAKAAWSFFQFLQSALDMVQERTGVSARALFSRGGDRKQGVLFVLDGDMPDPSLAASVDNLRAGCGRPIDWQAVVTLLQLAAQHVSEAQPQLVQLRELLLTAHAAPAGANPMPAADSVAAGRGCLPATGSGASSNDALTLDQCAERLGLLNTAVTQAVIRRAGETAVAGGTATQQQVEAALQLSLTWRGHAPADSAGRKAAGAEAAGTEAAPTSIAALVPVPGVRRGSLRRVGKAVREEGQLPAKRKMPERAAKPKGVLSAAQPGRLVRPHEVQHMLKEIFVELSMQGTEVKGLELHQELAKRGMLPEMTRTQCKDWIHNQRRNAQACEDHAEAGPPSTFTGETALGSSFMQAVKAKEPWFAMKAAARRAEAFHAAVLGKELPALGSTVPAAAAAAVAAAGGNAGTAASATGDAAAAAAAPSSSGTVFVLPAQVDDAQAANEPVADLHASPTAEMPSQHAAACPPVSTAPPAPGAATARGFFPKRPLLPVERATIGGRSTGTAPAWKLGDIQQQPIVNDDEAVRAAAAGSRVLAAQMCTGTSISFECSVAGRTTQMDGLRTILRFCQSFVLMPAASTDGDTYIVSAALANEIRKAGGDRVTVAALQAAGLLVSPEQLRDASLLASVLQRQMLLTPRVQLLQNMVATQLQHLLCICFALLSHATGVNFWAAGSRSGSKAHTDQASWVAEQAAKVPAWRPLAELAARIMGGGIMDRDGQLLAVATNQRRCALASGTALPGAPKPDNLIAFHAAQHGGAEKLAALGPIEETCEQLDAASTKKFFAGVPLNGKPADREAQAAAATAWLAEALPRQPFTADAVAAARRLGVDDLAIVTRMRRHRKPARRLNQL